MIYTVPVLPKGKRYINRWTSYSPRLNRDVFLYNDLEYDNWSLIEMDPLIETFCEQPLRIKQLVNGSITESTFDMWVRYKNGDEVLYSLVYSTRLDLTDTQKNSKTSRKINAQRLWSEENNFTYIVRTDQNIRQNIILLANMKTLIPYLKQHIVPIETDIYCGRSL